MTLIQLTSLFVCVVVSVVSESAPDAGKTKLAWKNHYDAAKELAQQNARPLVVVLENPSIQNEQIDESKLLESDRKKITKEKFELVRVNVTTDYGKQVAAAFGAKRFPYTAVTDDKSRLIVFRKAGQMSPSDWTLALATSVKTKPIVSSSSQQPSQPSQPAQPDSIVSDESRLGLGSVQWVSDFDRGQQEMQATGRPMLLFLTAPGCTYCEILKREALRERFLIDDINSKFTPVQVDGRARKDLADRFRVRMFPTLVVMRPNGEVVETWSGFQGTNSFASRLAAAKSKLRSIFRR